MLYALCIYVPLIGVIYTKRGEILLVKKSWSISYIRRRESQRYIQGRCVLIGSAKVLHYLHDICVARVRGISRDVKLS